MKTASFSGGRGWHVRDLERALAAQGRASVFVPFQTLEADPVSARAAAAGAECVLVRAMPAGTLEQIVFRLNLLQRLAAEGVRVINAPAALEACIDKYLCSAKLSAAGLPTPPTRVAQTSAQALAAYAGLGGDCVVKPLFGSRGRGCVRVADRETARRVFQAWESCGAVIYLQPYLRSAGYDYRALVVGGEVAAAMRRWPAAGEWRANVDQGGRAEAANLDAELEALAVRAARAVGAEVAGVDLLPGGEGRVDVLEVNGVPGWRALAAATGVDIAAAVARYAAARR
jgi:RimK family alpha-L-glutamate ligase